MGCVELEFGVCWIRIWGM